MRSISQHLTIIYVFFTVHSLETFMAFAHWSLENKIFISILQYIQYIKRICRFRTHFSDVYLLLDNTETFILTRSSGTEFFITVCSNKSFWAGASEIISRIFIYKLNLMIINCSVFSCHIAQTNYSLRLLEQEAPFLHGLLSHVTCLTCSQFLPINSSVQLHL